MSVGIMQPYFFPYIGYYSLIEATDRFILFDPVQFIRHGWIERNRILKPDSGWQYVQVPLIKASRDTLIRDMKIKPDEKWRERIVAQLTHYKKRSPFYAQTLEVIREAITIDTESIVDLNAHVLKTTCDYLGIPLNCQIFSEMHLEIEPVAHAGEWALNICKAVGVDHYINPSGGTEIFKPAQFEAAEIKLSFLKNNLPSYSQRRGAFEPGLSIIDVMMFNDSAAVTQMINDYELTNG